MYLCSYINKQNFLILGSQNLYVVIKKPMYPLRVTIWCTLWSGGIIGPFCFLNQLVNVTSDMPIKFVWPKIKDLHLNDIWFQQDGMTCHKAHDTIDFLRTKFSIV